MDGAAGPVLAAAVADGAGSAVHSREGARAVVRGILREAERYFAAADGLPDAAEAEGWLDAVRDAIGEAAWARDAAPRDFAATLVAVLATETEAVVLHVGDGAAVVGDEAGGWEVASWPAGGEYAGTTYFVTDREPRLVVRTLARRIDRIALFTDGIEHLVLEERERRAFAPFFDRRFAAIGGAAGVGCDRTASRALRAYLRGPAVNARTDDDKSLVLAVRG